MYNYFAHGHFDLCRNIFFPHGPLDFLRYPLPFANNLCIAIFFHLVLQPENNNKEPLVKRIKINCYDITMTDKNFTLQFEELIFDRTEDFAAMYFNKR